MSTLELAQDLAKAKLDGGKELTEEEVKANKRAEIMAKLAVARKEQEKAAEAKKVKVAL